MVLALLAVLSGTPSVCAQGEPIELRWDAPTSCPAADAVRARVRSLAGTGAASGLPLRAAATVTQRADGSYHMRLVVQKDGLEGERLLVARSCQDLAGAAAVNLALLIEEGAPLAAASASSVDTSPVAATPPAPPASPSQASPEAARATEPNALRAVVQGPSLSFGLGPMPAPSVGFSLAAGAVLAPWHFVAGGTAWLEHASASTRPDTSATLDRIQGTIRVCRAFQLSSFGLAPCLSVSVEHLRAHGTGPYVRPASADTTWLAAGAGLQARYRLTPWLNVLCGADLKLQTARPRISIEGIGAVTQLGWLSAELSLGSEWIL